MNVCTVCGQECSGRFCCDDCAADHAETSYEIAREDSPDGYWDGEPDDIDSDFGYDPYSGGPENDEPIDPYGCHEDAVCDMYDDSPEYGY